MPLRKPLVLVSGRPTELGTADTISGEMTLMGTTTVGETTLVTASLGVKRYTVTVAGVAVGDRIVTVLTGTPGNGTLQDSYVSAANTVSVGVMVPALGVGAVIAVPVAVYRVN